MEPKKNARKIIKKMKNPQEKMKLAPGLVALPDPLQNLLNVYLELIPLFQIYQTYTFR